jgi:hypothetical protein
VFHKEQTMKQHSSSTSPLTVVGIVLYVLAAIVFLLGAYTGLAFANARAALWGATIAFRSPQLMPLWDALASGLVFVGAGLFVISLIVSALLVASGLLLRRSVVLSGRVQRLEAALERVNIPQTIGTVPQTPLAESASAHL